jgi:hypothetical protein
MEIQKARAMAQLFSVYGKKDNTPCIPADLFSGLANEEGKLMRAVLMWLLINPEDELIGLSVRYIHHHDFETQQANAVSIAKATLLGSEQMQNYILNKYQISDDKFWVGFEDWEEGTLGFDNMNFIFKTNNPHLMIGFFANEIQGITSCQGNDPKIYADGKNGTSVCVQANKI